MTDAAQKKFSKNMRVFSRTGDEEFVIEAQAPVEGAAEAFRRVAFKSSMIDMLFEVDADISGMVLKNGVTIPVALRFAALKEKIYNNDISTGNSLDLSLVTGQAVVQAQEVRLSRRFNPVAEERAAAGAGESELDITLFVHRKSSDREFKRVTVPESKIAHFEPHANRPQTETFIKMKSGHAVEGWTEFYTALPITYFTYYLKQAREDGQKTLNLMESTRPKDAKNLRMG
jgi:hypothetical protein